MKHRYSDWLMPVTATVILALPIVMLAIVLFEGIPGLTWSFLFSEPLDAGRQGGIGPLLISTLWVLGLCLFFTVPVGLGCALFLSECVQMGSSLQRYLSFSLDALAAVPSIVFGLFGYTLFALYLGLGFSILSGALSLACMVLPLFIRISEQALRSCPYRYRQSATALNVSEWGFIRRILLPYSAGGIVVAVIISIGRALAETAVLVFTAGYVTRMPESVFDSGRVLSVHIYDLSMNVPGGQQNAATTAVVLLLLLVLINTVARRLVRRWQLQHLADIN